MLHNTDITSISEVQLMYKPPAGGRALKQNAMNTELLEIKQSNII